MATVIRSSDESTPAPDAPDNPAPPHRWGLLPEPGADGRQDPASVLRYWFVEFNPLYFVSALCVLCGIFLVARNIDTISSVTPEQAQLILFFVLQSYELLLIGGAAFLAHRAGALRPAVLLAMLEALFLFDCTFRLEGLALTGPLAAPLMLILWLILTAAKVWAVAKIFRIALPHTLLASVVATAAGIVALIAGLSQPGSNKVLVLQLAALFGTGVLFQLEARRPPLFSSLGRTEAQHLLNARCIQAVFRLLAGAYFYHVWSYILLAASTDVRAAAILPQAGAFFLLYTIIRKSDKEAWLFGALAVVSALPTAAHAAWALFVVAGVFAWRVWHGARMGMAVGAAFMVYGGLWLIGWTDASKGLPPLPAILSWQTALLGVALGLIGWFMRDPVVWALLAAGIGYGAYRTLEPLVPKSELGLGVLLLGAGFLAFLVGIAVNWWFRARRSLEPSD